MDSLCNELLGLIFADADNNDLIEWALVCSGWRPVAQSLLFRTITICGTFNLDYWNFLLCRNCELGRYVRALSVRPYGRRQYSQRKFDAIVEMLPNLRRLHARRDTVNNIMVLRTPISSITTLVLCTSSFHSVLHGIAPILFPCLTFLWLIGDASCVASDPRNAMTDADYSYSGVLRWLIVDTCVYAHIVVVMHALSANPYYWNLRHLEINGPAPSIKMFLENCPIPASIRTVSISRGGMY